MGAKASLLLVISFFTISKWANAQSAYLDGDSVMISKLQDQISKIELLEHLKILASDTMEGRETGKRGNQLAANYLSQKLSEAGFKPLDSDTSFLQPFEFLSDDWILQEFRIGDLKLTIDQDYVIVPWHSFSAGTFYAKSILLVHDHAIKKLDWKDLKATLIIIYGQKENVSGRWLEDVAKKNLVLFVNDDFHMTHDVVNGQPFYLNGNPLYKNYAYIKSEKLNAWILNQKKKVFEQFLQGHIGSIKISRLVFFRNRKEVKPIKTANVVGYIDNKDSTQNSSKKYMVLSGHFDHLGKKGNSIYYGADDNGSGCSAIVALAKYLGELAKNNALNKRIIVAFMTGEEMGLIGSHYFTATDFFKKNKFECNVNIDMIGRFDKNHQESKNPYIYVIGADRISKDLDSVISKTNVRYNHLDLDYRLNALDDPERLYERSDHFNFAKNGIPSVFFFSGLHEDYHKTSDTFDKLNYQLFHQRTKFLFTVVSELAIRKSPLR